MLPVHKRYTVLVLAFSLSTLTLVLLVNLIVDPYDLYQIARLKGVNVLKPAFRKHSRMSKAAAVVRHKPSAIVLGSSRAEYGLDPAHPGWSVRPVYNLAISGANIYETRRYLEHAHAVSTLKQLVLGLDFFMFNGAKPNIANFSAKRLAVAEDGTRQPGAAYADLAGSLLSLDALSDSLDTIKRQGGGDVMIFLPNGLREPRCYQKTIDAEGGYHVAFEHSMNAYYQRGSLINTAGPHRFFHYEKSEVQTFENFRRIVHLAYSEGIDAHFFISPVHAHHLYVLRRQGLWECFATWKRTLLKIIVDEAAASDHSPFPLWDFSGYSDITTEVVPAKGDEESQMQWYWESAHYKKEAGDLVLDRILLGKGADGFGVRLSPENIESHLSRQDCQAIAYEREHALDLADFLKTSN